MLIKFIIGLIALVVGALIGYIYRKNVGGGFVLKNPTKYLLEYLELQGVILPKDTFGLGSVNNGDAKENRVEIDKK